MHEGEKPLNESENAYRTLEKLFEGYNGDCVYTEWDIDAPVGKERFWEEENRIAGDEMFEEAGYTEVTESTEKVIEKYNTALNKLAGIEEDEKNK